MSNAPLQPKTPERSLKKLAVNGSIWTLGGYAAAQALRLASNVILAKLLFPEAFGLMVLVTIFMQGISMFSDIGIGPSIIQNKRGDDASFLNTAWTIQVIRGFAIWIIACISAYPYAAIYNEPLLSSMLPIAGLTAVIAGFNSTSLATSNRKLNLGKLTIIEFIAQAISIIVMIGWVLIHPTVWGLVAGGIVSALVKMSLSHTWLADKKNKLFWDKDAAGRLFRFGRWILASTALTFFAKQIDRMLLGFYLGTATLGIYSIAVMFKDTANASIQMLGSKVLFPSYSELVRSGDDNRVYKALKKTRLIMIVGSWVVSILLIFLGPVIIGYLYDERYSDAIWMIQILPLGPLVGVLSLTYQNMYLAKGRSDFITLILVLQLILQTFVIIAGYYYFQLLGVIIGLAMIGWLIYPINAYLIHKLKLWQPGIDITVIMAAIIFTLTYLKFMNFLI
ncbi:oligosaccharide flippase family protein [Methylophaga pinxianii]|uniref:oligosaccharide flippase family protein n=1 Tax=Methylophaga pinxianii TaxID=2881052 RepID=UPI001CF3076C|nr:oligosaccharide flippase family protein [Methylophaga pinxianii]MCB2425874.1 oligosaccharide flippase family protein [Methylophaga pinxianii]UPH45114.1 oligosaccharide flippase family protein [Methylophaga pinxianii]